MLEHDFAKVQILYREFEAGLSMGGTRKSRSDYREHCAELARNGICVTPELMMKGCKHCRKVEKDPKVKFQYCDRCLKVCYCSKECQKANWIDHKLACKKD